MGWSRPRLHPLYCLYALPFPRLAWIVTGVAPARRSLAVPVCGALPAGLTRYLVVRVVAVALDLANYCCFTAVTSASAVANRPNKNAVGNGVTADSPAIFPDGVPVQP